MQVTYAGTVIAADPSEGGLDAVKGFVPGDGKTEIQTENLTRGSDSVSFARGNRKRTIAGSVTLSSQPDLATAMVLRGTLFDSLPDSGDLVLRVGSKLITFAGALLQSCTVIKEFAGVAVGFNFTFVPQGPAGISDANDITDEKGNPITDQSGNPITFS